jgi:hypothetical protein
MLCSVTSFMLSIINMSIFCQQVKKRHGNDPITLVVGSTLLV